MAALTPFIPFYQGNKERFPRARDPILIKMQMQLPESLVEEAVLVWQVETTGIRPLHPQEQAIARNFGSQKRQEEFALARQAARQAMEALGYPPLPVGKGPRGEPLWPLGQVASLAHNQGAAVCVLAKRTSSLIGLGIDLEPVGRTLSGGAISSVFNQAERSLLKTDQDALVAFAAKEAVFKCLYPLSGVWFGFAGAELINLEKGHFQMNLKAEVWPGKLPSQPLRGHWWQAQQRIFALVGLDQSLKWI